MSNNVAEFTPVRDHGIFVSDLISEIANANYYVYKLGPDNKKEHIYSPIKSMYQARLKNIFIRLMAKKEKTYIDSNPMLSDYFKNLKQKYESLNLQDDE